MRASNSAGFKLLIVLLLLAGLGFRLAPLFNHDGRLLRQFPTEDAYLMLTVARNLGLGNGMSTAAGTIPTNGTQPAVTFLWAGCYRLVDGDKVLGIGLVQVVEIVIGALAALLLYRLGRLVWSDQPGACAMAALVASIWYAAPLCVEHSQNCLETGAYTLSVIVVALALVAGSRDPDRPWSITLCIGLGALLGAAFWIRNDAALLILAACLTRTLSSFRFGYQSRARRFTEAVVMGATSVCVALPWLIYNKMHFGSIVPISGISEAAFIEFGTNCLMLPPKLSEYACVIGAIPRALESHPVVLVICGVIVTAMVALLVHVWRHAGHAVRTLLSVVVIYGIGLCVFYGLFFGAGHFMSRYLFPLSPFFAILWVAVAFAFWDRLRTSLLDRARVIVPVLVLAGLLALNVRLYLKGDNHMHFQVVEWVAEHIPENAWVGAPQTGTLGYFHDRTVNLDGKVNPEALQARLHGKIPQYVLDKNIEYLADWVGLASWAELPTLKSRFELIVEDHSRNLAVLRRRQG